MARLTTANFKLRSSPFSKKYFLFFILIFATIGTLLLIRSFALNPNLPGDVNDDNKVDITDLSLLLSNYNRNYSAADFNSDAIVDISDLSILLTNYGRTYTPSGSFTTSLSSGMTITPPYTWTFNPGESSTKGYFWADGNLLKTIDGPGPYTFTIQSTTLTAGAHTLGHAWDTPDGQHKAPTSSYSVTIAGSVTPPPPPSTEGKILYSDSFEQAYSSPTGLNPLFWGWQDSHTLSDPTRGTIDVVNSPAVGAGSRSVRIVLKTTSTVTAAEMLHGRTSTPGKDNYYGIMYYFPSGWKEPSSAFWGSAVAQFNYEAIWGSPAGLAAHADHLSLAAQTGNCVYAQGCQWTNGAGGEVSDNMSNGTGWQVIPAGRMTTGTWHEVIVHIYWTINNDGVYEAWWRPKGTSSWTKTVDKRGAWPTLQWGTDIISGITWTPENIAQKGTNDKFGGYHAGSDWSSTHYIDNVLMGDTFSVVAGQMP